SAPSRRSSTSARRCWWTWSPLGQRCTTRCGRCRPGIRTSARSPRWPRRTASTRTCTPPARTSRSTAASALPGSTPPTCTSSARKARRSCWATRTSTGSSSPTASASELFRTDSQVVRLSVKLVILFVMDEQCGANCDTIVWITGATQGLGSGLARTCLHADAHVINLSRSPHPELENVAFDLTKPDTWSSVRESFRRHLAGFTGSRAIFIHNAYFSSGTGFAGEVDEEQYYSAVMANAVAPLVLADWFLREVKPGYESGLVLISSAAARMPFEGNSVYGAAKAGVEQWVRVVRRERTRRGTGPWVVAAAPGFAASPSLRKVAALDPHNYPMSRGSREGIDNGRTLGRDEAGR